ncbi:MAG: ABC transporter ATP-binding protein [Bifidobacteriaceae bacterium]|nr:ABC transporter ATP-binding protein [Bifidobacteriaceae bacterium]
MLAGVNKTYVSGLETVQALDHVSLTLNPGEFLAVTGASGSGKSTLLQCASGLDSVDSGMVALAGTDITGLADRPLTKLRRKAAGFVFQAYNLFSSKTAKENILYPLRLQGRRPDAKWVDWVVKALGLDSLMERYPNELSGGQQQRVAIARSMVAKPRVLFADEPTGALDSAASEQLLDLFQWSSQELGQSILMVTHDPLAAARADRVVEMSDGKVVADSGAGRAASNTVGSTVESRTEGRG